MTAEQRELRVLSRERHLAPELIPASVVAFLRMLAGPSLIHVTGRDRSRTRALVTLLHGNEPSGLRGVHRWLRSGAVPAVDIRIFIGAVRTALTEPGFAYRTLPGGRDMNRCWLPPFEGEHSLLVRAVLAALRESSPEALIDLHNNTGHNPPYGVGPLAGPAELGLVSLFGERYVHNTIRLGSLVEATAAEFASINIECGRAGDPAADEVAHRGIVRFLEDEIPNRAKPIPQIFVDPVRVSVRSGIELAFGERPVPGADFTVVADIDRHNFESLEPGVPIGWLGEREVWPVEALGADGEDRSRTMFSVREDRLETCYPIVPIMMTTDPRNVLADCLFYAVSRR